MKTPGGDVVFLVSYEYPHDGGYLVGVFDDEALAIGAMQRHASDDCDPLRSYDITPLLMNESDYMDSRGYDYKGDPE